MATKKTAGKSGKAAKKKTAAKKTTARRAGSTPAPVKTTVKQKTQTLQKPPNNQSRSVILVVSGALIACLALIEGSKIWLKLHNMLRGFFGVGVLFVPIIMFYTAWLITQDRSKQASGRAVWGLLLTLLVSCFVQLFVGDTPMAMDPATGNKMIFRESVKLLYENGKDMIGGGLISGVIVIPLIMLFDVTGAKIIVTLVMIMLFMLLSNRGFSEMFRLIARPFVWMWGGITKAATRGLEGFREDFYSDDEDEYDEEEEFEEEPEIEEPAPVYVRGSRRKQPEPEPEPEPAPAPRRSRRVRDDDAAHLREVERMLAKGAAIPKRTELRNIDLDIPIYDNGVSVSADEMNQLTGNEDEGVNGFKMSKEEAAHLQALVEHAAKESDEENNRLPWLEDDESASDNSIYDEEPEIPYTAPSLSLLRRAVNNANDADKSAELREKGELLVDTLKSFGLTVRITGIRRGPTVTRYEIQPAAGVKISKITALADDIGLNLGGLSVRISQVEGKPALGVEVPNNTKDTVTLREILESKEFQESESRLTFAVGKDIDGHVILGDIAKMPHMIIAGTTGSGKSVCTNSIIMSILFHASPDEVRMVLIDPKVVEFQPYDGVPHLLIPVVTNPQKAAGALNWAVIEMERRYMLCAQYGVRDLKGYNAVAEKTPELKPLPQILIIIDEFADLMMTSGKEVESAVIRIAQKARAAGIHLVIATQRPTVDVITGLIKSNVPSRIGMSVKAARDSINILDCSGAEKLLGNGDLLFYPNGFHEPKRVQGCFCSDSEVEAVASFLKSGGSAEYDADIMSAVEQNTPVSKTEKSAAADEPGELTGEEALIVKAAELAVDMGQLSTTALQRRLKLGYAKAARIVDELESRGIVGPSEGAKPRKVMMTPQELTEWKCSLAAKGGKVE